MSIRYHAAVFTSEHALMEAARTARRNAWEIEDAYTPYPIHGLDEVLGRERSRLAVVGFGAGVAGLALALLLQWWTSAVDWPLNVGGKPFNSFPVFIPVAFELTVLFSGFIALGILLLRTRLWPGSRRRALPGVTDDRFALVLVERDGSFEPVRVYETLRGLGAEDIWEGEHLV